MNCEALAVASLGKIGVHSSAITAAAPEVRVVTYDLRKHTVETIANAAADGFDADPHHPPPIVTLIYLNYSPRPEVIKGKGGPS